MGTRPSPNASLEANLQETVRAAGSQIILGDPKNNLAPRVDTHAYTPQRERGYPDIPSSVLIAESDPQESAREEADSIIQKYGREPFLPGDDRKTEKINTAMSLARHNLIKNYNPKRVDS